MRTTWSIETHGKPLDTVIELLINLWDRLNVRAMLLPLKISDGSWQVEEITDPQALQRANPFTPIMQENIAPRIPLFQQKYPGEKIAALLRPCEVQALYKITENVPLDKDNLIVFCADCLGTFPSDEFIWRAERKGPKETLSEEALHFSKFGGIAPYRYRAACQLCKNPIANQADINFNIIGIPVRKKMLLSTYNGLAGILSETIPTPPNTDTKTLNAHDSIAEKLVYRNTQTFNRLSQEIIEDTGLNLEILIEQLNACEDCQACMQVCPMCQTFDFRKNRLNRFSRETVINWMLSCIGCGMCEQACSQHKPLAAIFATVNQQLQEMY